MAKSTRTRALNDEGNLIRFSHQLFDKALRKEKMNRSKAGKKCSLENLYSEIADAASVSVEAVRNWKKGYNGVGDIEIIKTIGKVLNVEYKDLTIDNDIPEKTVDQRFEPVNSEERDLIIQVYQLLVEFIYWFGGTYEHSRAIEELDNPLEEMEKYIMELYRFLDKIGLLLTSQNYRNLRKTITEVIKTCYNSRQLSTGFPSEWTAINPRLKSPEFHKLMYYEEDVQDITEIPYCMVISNPDDLLHMYFEDRPDLVKKAERIKMGEEASTHLIITNPEKVMDLVQEIADTQGNPDNEKLRAYNASLYKNAPLSVVMEQEDDLICFPVYHLIAMESANTLIKVMRKRFPSFFSEIDDGDRYEPILDHIRQQGSHVIHLSKMKSYDIDTLRNTTMGGNSEYHTLGDMIESFSESGISIPEDRYEIYAVVYAQLLVNGTPSSYLAGLRRQVYKQMPVYIRTISVDEYEMTGRLQSLLQREKCLTIGDMIELPDNLKGLGKQTKRELEVLIASAIIDTIDTDINPDYAYTRAERMEVVYHSF